MPTPRPWLLIFHSTISLSPQTKNLFQKFLMTSLHAICGLAPQSKILATPMPSPKFAQLIFHELVVLSHSLSKEFQHPASFFSKLLKKHYLLHIENLFLSTDLISDDCIDIHATCNAVRKVCANECLQHFLQTNCPRSCGFCAGKRLKSDNYNVMKLSVLLHP